MTQDIYPFIRPEEAACDGWDDAMAGRDGPPPEYINGPHLAVWRRLHAWGVLERTERAQRAAILAQAGVDIANTRDAARMRIRGIVG